jgi:hypothetical protein
MWRLFGVTQPSLYATADLRSRSLESPVKSAASRPDGRTHFQTLLFLLEWPHFSVFDLLSIDGEDLTGLPLLERKRRLLRIIPFIESRLMYLDHIEERGRDLYRAACNRDLEDIVGEDIVGKWAHGTYRTDGRATSWVKLKHPEYSQMRGRHELFAARAADNNRGRTPCAFCPKTGSRRNESSRTEVRSRRISHVLG